MEINQFFHGEPYKSPSGTGHRDVSFNRGWKSANFHVEDIVESNKFRSGINCEKDEMVLLISLRSKLG